MSIKQLDGGFIHITGNKNLVSEWYSRHMGLTIAWDWPGMTILKFPCGDTITLEFKDTTHQYDRDGRVRFCFDCPDIPGVRRQLLAEHVHVSDIYEGPGSIPSFDFFDPCGNRLTAVEARDELKRTLPETRFMLFQLRIGVRDIDRSVDWYENMLQMRRVVHTPDYAVLHVGDEYRNNTPPLQPLPIVLEKVDAGGVQLLSSILPMFVTRSEEDLWYARNRLKELHVDVTEMEGKIREDGGLAQFFVTDPDLNRLSIYYYVWNED